MARRRAAPNTDLARLLQEALARDGGQGAQDIVAALIESARKGNVTALKELLAQMENVTPTEPPRIQVEVIFCDPPWEAE